MHLSELRKASILVAHISSPGFSYHHSHSGTGSTSLMKLLSYLESPHSIGHHPYQHRQTEQLNLKRVVTFFLPKF